MSYINQSRKTFSLLCTFPLPVSGVSGGAPPLQAGHQGQEVVIVHLEVSGALRAPLPQVGVQQMGPVVQVLLWQEEAELGTPATSLSS